MPANHLSKKTLWKDLGELRQPNSTWQLRNAAAWFERVLNLPSGAIVFIRSNGEHARPKTKLGSLRAEWENPQPQDLDPREVCHRLVPKRYWDDVMTALANSLSSFIKKDRIDGASG